MQCPTCTRTFDTEHGVKIHHARAHEESIAGEIVSCDNCGSSIRRKESAINETNFCNKSCKSEHQENIRGSEHPLYDRREVECDSCGDTLEKKPSRVFEYNFCDESCEADWRSEEYSGEGHPNYIDGRSYENYYTSDEWVEFRTEMEEVLDTDCQICGNIGDSRQNALHHIVPMRKFEETANANTRGNVVFLCQKHHAVLEKMDPEKQRKELSGSAPNIES